MQHRAMQLMSRKMAAAQALEGEFSEDGLAAMAGEDNLQMALAKSLADRIDQSDMQRSWTKVTSGPKSPRKPVTPRPMDDVPEEVGSVFPGILERIAAVDKAFAGLTQIEPRQPTVDESFQPTPTTVGLKLHRPEPVTADETEADETFEVPKFDEELLAKMFANLTANGMTLGDLAG